VMARTDGDRATIEPFMTGMLDEANNQYYSRPSYLLQMPDGSILVSDEHHGATYRISYSAPASTEKK
jgi:glucose/arabinose dehydrogenase